MRRVGRWETVLGAARKQPRGPTVHDEIPSEPTVVVVPVFTSEPGVGFGVDIGGGWAAPGLISSLRTARVTGVRRDLEVQTLTDVNTMLFRILATPEP